MLKWARNDEIIIGEDYGRQNINHRRRPYFSRTYAVQLRGGGV
jgi:hypothetical protein